MNSQQAINLLKGLEQSLDDYCELNDEGKAAFRMAITALELFGNSEQLPSAQPESDKIYGIMKDYYFEHKDEHDQSWQGGFAKCMNLIPNVWERREDGSD